MQQPSVSIETKQKTIVHRSHQSSPTFANHFSFLSLSLRRPNPTLVITLKYQSASTFEINKTFLKKIPRNQQQLLLCATQSLFTCDTLQGNASQANGSSPTSIQVGITVLLFYFLFLRFLLFSSDLCFSYCFFFVGIFVLFYDMSSIFGSDFAFKQRLLTKFSMFMIHISTVAKLIINTPQSVVSY